MRRSQRLFGPMVVSLGAGLGTGSHSPRGGDATTSASAAIAGPSSSSSVAASQSHQEELGRLLATRTTVAVRFSPLQVSVLVDPLLSSCCSCHVL